MCLILRNVNAYIKIEYILYVWLQTTKPYYPTGVGKLVAKGKAPHKSIGQQCM